MDTQEIEILPIAELSASDDLFVIDTEDKVNWYLRKLANIEAERARVKAQAAAIIARLDTDEAGLKYRFENQVIEWTRQQIDGTRRKSHPTLQGTLCFRSQGPRLAFGDLTTDAALTCAAGWKATRPTIDRTAYLAAAEKVFVDTGELLPGIERVDAKETFSVSFGKSKSAIRNESSPLGTSGRAEGEAEDTFAVPGDRSKAAD